MSAEVTEVIVRRSKLYPQVALPGPEWRWIYDYQVTAPESSSPITYGTHLASCMDRLKWRFPNARIVKSWLRTPK